MLSGLGGFAIEPMRFLLWLDLIVSRLLLTTGAAFVSLFRVEDGRFLKVKGMKEVPMPACNQRSPRIVKISRFEHIR